MGRYLAVRDKRLHGGVPAHARLGVINADEGTHIRGVINHVRAFAAAGQIHTVFVLCHGYAGVNVRLHVSADAGGMGLQLGKEGLMHSNVAEWGAIKNLAQNIVVYACAAADTEPGNQYTKADGQYLMGALALHTNSNVYASNRIQWYHTFRGLPNGAFDFGTWEGELFKFARSSGVGVQVPSVPVELTDVLRGRAP